MEILHQFESCYEAMLPAQEKGEEAFVWFSGLPHFFFNPVMHLRCQDTKKKVDEVLQGAPGGVSFWVHPENRAEGLAETLEGKGFINAMKCPLMGWDVGIIEAVAGDFRKGDAEVFDQMTSVIFSMEGELLDEFCGLMKKIHSENYILYVDGKPAATGILLPNGTSGGVFNLGVLPEFRGKGLARKMMAFLMCRAGELKLSKLVLLSSPELEQMYTSLGFEKAFDVEIFASPQ